VFYKNSRKNTAQNFVSIFVAYAQKMRKNHSKKPLGMVVGEKWGNIYCQNAKSLKKQNSPLPFLQKCDIIWK
jgi:hypothetical protein